MLEKGKLKSAAFNAAGLGAVFVCTLSVLFYGSYADCTYPKGRYKEKS